MVEGLINITGMIFSLSGVLLLFRFGMPYHVPAGGITFLAINAPTDQQEVEKEKKYKKYSWLGLILIVAGTILQILVTALGVLEINL